MTDMLEPATILDDVYQTLTPEPLDDGKKLQAFYSDDLNAVRGGDKVKGILLNLRRHFGKTHYRAFLMGHQGVGKSTELSRLIYHARSQFRPIRFSATRDLNPAGFTPFDVLLVMLVRLMDEMGKCDAKPPSDSLLNGVKKWFATTTHNTGTFRRQSGSDCGNRSQDALSSCACYLAGRKFYSASKVYNRPGNQD